MPYLSTLSGFRFWNPQCFDKTFIKSFGGSPSRSALLLCEVKMVITVKCPKCNHDQKCNPVGVISSSKVKKCVYCGRSFKIHPSVDKTRIVNSPSLTDLQL
jgi:hypothetical protein